jgi:hypothetical protein
MFAECPIKVKGPKGLSTVGVDHSYGVFDVSKIDNCGEAGKEFDIPPNNIIRPFEARKGKG